MSGPASAAEAGRRGLRDCALPAGLVATALGAGALFALMHEGITDDGYITLVYARNLATQLHWGLLPDQVSNMATAPGFVLLLAAVTFVVRAPVVALGLVYMAQSAAAFYALYQLGRHTGLGRRLAFLCTPLLVLNPLLASSVGLETTFAATLLIYLTWAAAAASPRWFGVVAGLLVLTRLDLGIFVALLFLTRPALLRRGHVAIAWAAAVVLPWLLFSWIVLGSAIPDTFVFKQQQAWGRFGLGLYDHGTIFPWAVASALVVPAVGLLATAGWPLWRRLPGLRDTSPVAVLGLGGVAYYLAYLMLGVPPYFWYYGPPVAALTVAGCALLSALTARLDLRARPVVVTAATLGLLAPMAAAWAVTAQHRVPLDRMPIHVNWATPVQYAEIGRELGSVLRGRAVRGHGETGVLLFFCRCHIVDNFTDRGRLAGLIEDAKQDSVWMRLNYAFLDTASLRADEFHLRLGRRPGPDPRPRGWDMDNPNSGREHLVVVDLTRRRTRG